MIPLVVIVGPTGVGKSALAVELALRLGGEIVSADSVQVYKYFNIGTAKPTPAERKGVPHHLLDFLEPDEDFSVAQFQRLAREKILEIFGRGRLPFLVGGTGLYVQAVIDPYEFPETGDHTRVRRMLQERVRRGEGAQVYAELQRVDPETAARLHPHDYKRIIRALEVFTLTGRPISEFQKGRGEMPPYNLVMLGLTRNRKELYALIEARVEKMFREGLVAEVRQLLERFPPHLKPFQALGYRQVLGYLKGEYDLATAVELTKKQTRNYAKRQLTWFRRDPRIKWFLLEGDAVRESFVETVAEYIGRKIPRQRILLAVTDFLKRWGFEDVKTTGEPAGLLPQPDPERERPGDRLPRERVPDQGHDQGVRQLHGGPRGRGKAADGLQARHLHHHAPAPREPFL